MPIGVNILVNLWLDVNLLDAFPAVEAIYLDFVIEVTNVANDGLILHASHVLGSNDVAVTGGGNVDVSFCKGILGSFYLEAFHCSLKSTNWVNLGNDYAGTVCTHRASTTLTHVAVSANNHNLTGNHHVGSALDAVG